MLAGSNVKQKNKNMSKSVSMVIDDIFRWIIALILLPIVVWLLFLFFMYPFEWLLSKSTNWGLFLHILFWVAIGSSIVGLTTALGGLISSLSMFLVRQSVIYAGLLFLALLGLVGFSIYGAWSDNVEYSWEFYRYATLNKILFTLLILNLLQIPLAMLGGTSGE